MNADEITFDSLPSELASELKARLQPCIEQQEPSESAIFRAAFVSHINLYFQKFP